MAVRAAWVSIQEIFLCFSSRKGNPRGAASVLSYVRDVMDGPGALSTRSQDLPRLRRAHLGASAKHVALARILRALGSPPHAASVLLYVRAAMFRRWGRTSDAGRSYLALVRAHPRSERRGAVLARTVRSLHILRALGSPPRVKYSLPSPTPYASCRKISASRRGVSAQRQTPSAQRRETSLRGLGEYPTDTNQNRVSENKHPKRVTERVWQTSNLTRREMRKGVELNGGCDQDRASKRGMLLCGLAVLAAAAVLHASCARTGAGLAANPPVVYTDPVSPDSCWHPALPGCADSAGGPRSTPRTIDPKADVGTATPVYDKLKKRLRMKRVNVRIDPRTHMLKHCDSLGQCVPYSPPGF